MAVSTGMPDEPRAKMLAALYGLMTIRKEVFHDNPDGDLPNPFVDYDRACELFGMLNDAIKVLEGMVKR